MTTPARASSRSPWDDPAARDELVSALASDALVVLAELEQLYPAGDGLDDKAAQAGALLALSPASRPCPAAGSRSPHACGDRSGLTAPCGGIHDGDAVRGRRWGWRWVWRWVWRWTRRVVLALLALVVLVFAASGAYLGWDRLDPVRLDVAVPGFNVDAGGVRTHVEHWPAAHPSGRAPLVLIPGFAESTYVWSRVAPLLAADRDVYAYDVRGYGFTDHVPPYDLAADTDQLGGVLAALHLGQHDTRGSCCDGRGSQRPVVVGHSSGVAIALSWALRAPDSVAGVLAANGDGTPYFGANRTSSGRGPRWLLVDPIAPAIVTAAVRHRAPIRSIVTAQCGPGCPADDAAIDRWRAPFLLPGAVDALVSMARRPLIGLTDAQETTVAVPTAIVYSSEDGSFSGPQVQATAARLHTSLVAELPGARHLALLGEPDRFAAAVRPEIAALDRH